MRSPLPRPLRSRVGLVLALGVALPAPLSAQTKPSARAQPVDEA